MKNWLIKHHQWATILALASIALGGCATVPAGSTQSLKPVCDALGPPHVYNSKNKDSAYHAGPKVAPRLARDNRVGTNLHCNGY